MRDILRDGIVDAADEAAFLEQWIVQKGDAAAGRPAFDGRGIDTYVCPHGGGAAPRVPIGCLSDPHYVDNRLGFAGYVWDPHLHMWHVRHRVYDPGAGGGGPGDGVGRWLQRDPIGLAGGLNLYQYCGNEPTGKVDVSGLISLLAIADDIATAVEEIGDAVADAAEAVEEFVHDSGDGIMYVIETWQEIDSVDTYMHLAPDGVDEMRDTLQLIMDIPVFGWVAGVALGPIDGALAIAQGDYSGILEFIPAGRYGKRIARSLGIVDDAGKRAAKGPFRGGAYGKLRGGRGVRERHHMPAKSVNGMDTHRGGAIEMDAADHRKTKSVGRSKEAEAYRAHQRELIQQGRFREALDIEIEDVKRVARDVPKHVRKYDRAIRELSQYYEREGVL